MDALGLRPHAIIRFQLGLNFLAPTLHRFLNSTHVPLCLLWTRHSGDWFAKNPSFLAQTPAEDPPVRGAMAAVRFAGSRVRGLAQRIGLPKT
jgi:hypothetical protein